MLNQSTSQAVNHKGVRAGMKGAKDTEAEDSLGEGVEGGEIGTVDEVSGMDLFGVGTVSQSPLRLKGGGVQSDSDEDRTNESLFIEKDVTDELLFSPTSTKTQGVKRRSDSCEGRIEGVKEEETGSIFFHSTPVRAGAGGFSVSFKDDMDLIHANIVDLVKKKTKRRQELDKRWTRCPAKKRQPPKQSVEEAREQPLEDGVKVDGGSIKHDGVSGRGDDVSLHTDVRVVGFHDIREEDDSSKNLGYGEDEEDIQREKIDGKDFGDVKTDPGRSENDQKKEDDDENIGEMETDGGEEDRAGKKIDYVEREALDGETLEEMQERQDDPKEGQTQGDENHSGSFVEMNDDVNVEEEQHINENEEEKEKHDPFDFDDSLEDPLYVLPKRTAPLPSSATKRPRLSRPRKQPASSEAGTTPEHVKPDDVGQKRQKIDTKVLEFLVHRFAKAKRKNLATEVLSLSFFNELVRAYGAVPGGARLAPYTSGTDITRTSRWVRNDKSELLRCVVFVYSFLA